jgi:hypothetical protein
VPERPVDPADQQAGGEQGEAPGLVSVSEPVDDGAAVERWSRRAG